MYQFQVLEAEINRVLETSCHDLLADPAKAAYYGGLFDRTGETGFYMSDFGPRGHGETPGWAPNPAYMESGPDDKQFNQSFEEARRRLPRFSRGWCPFLRRRYSIG